MAEPIRKPVPAFHPRPHHLHTARPRPRLHRVAPLAEEPQTAALLSPALHPQPPAPAQEIPQEEPPAGPAEEVAAAPSQTKPIRRKDERKIRLALETALAAHVVALVVPAKLAAGAPALGLPDVLLGVTVLLTGCGLLLVGRFSRR
ncbi:MAG TPA: hypothetical protein VF756_19835 [Thermoanaerobaculia bacterium]